MDDKLSKWDNVVSGIPQGSVLSPLMFLLFIWDLNLKDLQDPKVIARIYKYVDNTKLVSKVKNEKDIEDTGRRSTRSMTMVERRELDRDKTSMFWLRMENTECYDDIAVYVVEVPVAEHKKVKVIEAKEKELENLTKYGVFEEVEDNGQERITSRWRRRKWME